MPILFLFPVESTNSSFSRIRFPFILIQLISRTWFHLGVSLNPLQKILFPFQTTNLWVCHYWRLFEYWVNPMNWRGGKGILWEDEIIFAPYVYCWGAKDVPSVLMSLILLTLCILFMLLWFQPITSFPAPDNRSEIKCSCKYLFLSPHPPPTIHPHSADLATLGKVSVE